MWERREKTGCVPWKAVCVIQQGEHGSQSQAATYWPVVLGKSLTSHRIRWDHKWQVPIGSRLLKKCESFWLHHSRALHHTKSQVCHVLADSVQRALRAPWYLKRLLVRLSDFPNPSSDWELLVGKVHVCFISVPLVPSTSPAWRCYLSFVAGMNPMFVPSYLGARYFERLCTVQSLPQSSWGSGPWQWWLKCQPYLRSLSHFCVSLPYHMWQAFWQPSQLPSCPP